MTGNKEGHFDVNSKELTEIAKELQKIGIEAEGFVSLVEPILNFLNKGVPQEVIVVFIKTAFGLYKKVAVGFLEGTRGDEAQRTDDLHSPLIS